LYTCAVCGLATYFQTDPTPPVFTPVPGQDMHMHWTRHGVATVFYRFLWAVILNMRDRDVEQRR